MTPYALATLIALITGGGYAIWDWRRERRDYERRIRDTAELLARLHEPTPGQVAREWRRFLSSLPEVKR